MKRCVSAADSGRPVFLLFLFAFAAHADIVLREQVTLGALADASDRIVLARVAGIEPEQVRLEVQDTIKGRAQPLLSLPRGGLSWSHGASLVVFLDDAEDGTPLALRSSWQRIEITDATSRDHLLEVIRGRLPTLGGDPRQLEPALFRQLASPIPRVSEDAALDLLARKQLAPGPDERAALQAAIGKEPRPELLELAARVPDAALQPSLLRAARAELAPRTRRLLAAALRAIDPASAQAALERDLRDPAAAIRRAALLTMAETAEDGIEDTRTLEQIARGGEKSEARKALAVLARGACGAALRRLEEHADAELRELAGKLREDPVELARRVLAE